MPVYIPSTFNDKHHLDPKQTMEKYGFCSLDDWLVTDT